MQQQELIPHLFRTEYSKITAVLCRRFNLQHLEIAEDIASETFLKAAETWASKGIPENPAAWLYTVAKNKTKDYLKRNTLFETQIRTAIQSDETHGEEELEFTQQSISDSQLAMMFAVCNPVNSKEAQICLALQILCGFSIEEIASAFLAKSETIKKRLFRARENLRTSQFEISIPDKTSIQSRLDTVLKTVYLLFSEGYFSDTNDQLIRKDLCSEAIRLALVLAENPLTNTGKVNALLALLCFQSSRLDARVNEAGEAILFDEQDKRLWNRELIDRGNHYLVNAFSGNEVSTYHLEAAIAYWHTTTDENKWQQILMLYNQLIIIEYSPITALNRTFALSKVHGTAEAIVEAEKLGMTENNFYQSLLGHLYQDIDPDQAIRHYEKAIELTKSSSEKQVLLKEIGKLNTSKGQR